MLLLLFRGEFFGVNKLLLILLRIFNPFHELLLLLLLLLRLAAVRREVRRLVRRPMLFFFPAGAGMV